MPRPTVQAQGTLAAVTTGTLTVTLPTHVAGDILLCAVGYWAPNTVGSVGVINAPSGWTKLAEIGDIEGGGSFDTGGSLALFWRRATASGTANPVFARPVIDPGGGATDSGTDTLFHGRAYIVRGTRLTGDPYSVLEVSNFGGAYAGTNGATPAFSVTGQASEKLPLLILVSSDDQADPAAPTDWTAPAVGVSVTTGTDARHKLFTAAPTVDTSYVSRTPFMATRAAGSGGYGYFAIVFDSTSVTSGTDLTQTIDDTLSLSDNTSLSAGRDTTINDTLGLSDNISPVSAFSRAVSDSVTLADDIGTPFMGIFRSIDDSLSLSDSVVAGILKLLGIDDALSLSDQTALALGRVVEISDSISLSDSIKIDRVFSLSDTFALSDSFSFDRGVVLGDSVSLSDAVAIQKGISQAIAESFSLADQVFFSRGVALSDSVTLADTTSLSRVLALQDALSVADAVSKSLGITLADTLDLADFIDPQLEAFVAENYTVNIDDTLSLNDALSFVHSVGLSDSVVIRDSNARQLNGLFLTDGTAVVKAGNKIIVIGRF